MKKEKDLSDQEVIERLQSLIDFDLTQIGLREEDGPTFRRLIHRTLLYLEKNHEIQIKLLKSSYDEYLRKYPN